MADAWILKVLTLEMATKGIKNESRGEGGLYKFVYQTVLLVYASKAKSREQYSERRSSAAFYKLEIETRRFGLIKQQASVTSVPAEKCSCVDDDRGFAMLE